MILKVNPLIAEALRQHISIDMLRAALRMHGENVDALIEQAIKELHQERSK